jgi:hypothetical protein
VFAVALLAMPLALHAQTKIDPTPASDTSTPPPAPVPPPCKGRKCPKPAKKQIDAPPVAAADDASAQPDAPAPPPCKGKKCPKAPKKKKAKKEKPPKVTPATITRGTFTVDGVIAKAGLNYNIPDLKFIYFYAPGIGAVIVSDNKFPGCTEQKNAFDGHTLTVKAGDHEMQLYSDDIMLGKKAIVGKSRENKKAEPAYVALDPNYTMPSRFPVVGYGDKAAAPYAWPGSRLNITTKGIDPDAPAIPARLTPKLAENPCPKDQVLINAPVAQNVSTANAKPKAPPKCVPAKDAPAAPYVPMDKRARE